MDTSMIEDPAKITFIQPGLLTSVQDLGRGGLAHYGIPYSGAMDQVSYRKANHLLENSADAACLEMAQEGPEMAFESETQIVFVGALCRILHNLEEGNMGKILHIKSGDSVRISAFQKGQWCYMAIKGGLESKTVAGSRSWYPGITPKSRINKNDNLFYLNGKKLIGSRNAHAKIDSHWFETDEIKVFPGPEWHLLGQEQKNLILNHHFSISPQHNRMGTQLLETCSNYLAEILTAPVYPGTVQLTPSGKIIILMRDAQVTGGYPRILHVTEESLNVLAQKRAHEKIKFCIIEQD